MLAITRKSKIKDIIAEKKSATVSELSKHFSVTEETIRRDLKTLEDEGFLIRTHGGAFVHDGVQNELNLSVREISYVENKETIATICMGLIQNGDSIFLDASTTSIFVCKAIRHMKLTVLTNSLKVINLLVDCKNIRLISIGGSLSPKSMAFLGSSAVQSLDHFYVDKAFISCRSLSMEHGITDSNELLAEIRQSILQRANKTYLIADYSKFDKTSFIKICDFNKLYAIVTDMKLSNEWRLFLEDINLKVYDNA